MGTIIQLHPNTGGSRSISDFIRNLSYEELLRHYRHVRNSSDINSSERMQYVTRILQLENEMMKTGVTKEQIKRRVRSLLEKNETDF